MKAGAVLFDWGDTLMVDFPEYLGPMAEWPRVEAMSGAAEALGRLKAAGWRTALATNAADSGPEEIRSALARVGLDTLIDHVYCSQDVGYAKPSPQFFAHIRNDLGLSTDELVMVGDNFPVDVRGANEAGIKAVLFRRGAIGVAGTDRWRVIGELGELPDLLSAWV